MNLLVLRRLLLWCLLINFAILFLWFGLLVAPHDWLYRLWGRWFHLSNEQFDAACFLGIMIYKLLVLVFNAVPYLALRIVGTGTDA